MQKRLPVLVLATVSALALTGCSAAAAPADDDALQVVASTNVYGQLAAEIGGGRVDVTSLIDSAEKDPHGYEATARDRLAVQKADLVIENGGGYDAFMQELIDGSDAAVITAAEFSHDYPDATVDEHGVWDYLGGLLVCREAGVAVVDAAGRDLVVRDHAARRTPVAGASPAVLDALLACHPTWGTGLARPAGP